jgi:membrane protease YdiL (CAAX protease family)
MRQVGSVATRTILPAWLGPLTAILGFLAMVALLRPASALGTRPALLVAELALVGPALLALAALRIPFGPGLALEAPDRRITLLAVATGLGFWVGSLGLLELQSFFWPPAEGYVETFRRLHEALRPRGPLDLLASVGAIALLPAVCEEILLRGVVLPSLRPALGAAGAVAASSLLFALIHDAYRMPFTFAVGLGLGALRVRTGSLVPPVLAHALLNTTTFLAAWVLDDPAQDLVDPRPLLGSALLVAGTVASLLTLRAARTGAATASPAPR